ncbi:MAG: translocation and assembly module TamB [Sphingomonadales bacterium]|nr:translocation and assembly module TamB [Sphingomonadales bacterium]
MDEEAGVKARRRPVKRLTALALLVLVLLALLVAWTQRRPIASDFIDRELARRHVRATYEVKRIGFRTERLENLVIGDPANPDLTARWVEVKLSWGLRRPRVTLITARGVRLNARLAKDGRIRFGEVDRLLPPPSGLPFRFPDQDVDLADSTIRFDTPAGRVGIALEGKGNLADGFRGRMAVAAPKLRPGNCLLGSVKGLWNVGVDDLRPSFSGPASASYLTCGDQLKLTDVGLDLTVRLAPGLDSWKGTTEVSARRLWTDTARSSNLSGRLGLDGNARMTSGALDLAAFSTRVGEVYALGRSSFKGRYALSLADGGFSLLGEADAREVSAGSLLAGAFAALRPAEGTPLGPVAKALAAALGRAAGDFDADATLRLVNGRGIGGVRFERLSAASRSGARIDLGGGQGLTYYWPSGLTRLDGDLNLAGGGLPAMRLSLSQPRPGSPIRGTGRIQPMRAGNSRLALGEIGFTAAPGGATRISTVATIDGPLDNGWVRGLVLPIEGRIDGRGGFVFGEGCAAARFDALQFGSLRLGRTALPLCPTGRALAWRGLGGRVAGGAEIRAPRFAGTLGASPLNIAGSRLSFALAGPSFAASRLTVGLGVNRFQLGSIAGDFGKGGVAGRFSGFSGKLANVPLLIGQGGGTWRVRNGDLAAEGQMRVADELDPPRFYPLIARDFRLTLADNRIKAGGWLDDPETGTRIVRADIGHSLATGRGRADLDVPGIAFGKDYQPEQLTRLTTGVIALVNGTLKGQGEIEWDQTGSHSSGTFSTDDMDFAAAFGPVEGLSTSLHFTDLLGLASAPGQEAKVGLVRAGIDVLDGRIRYQLLPGLRVKVESGRWPFAGGELILEETVLDFSKPSEKRLTFRVEGLDAALFIQKMEFANITATGTFDGVIPMVFDERGGRIVGGHLVARPQGGTLSYIGELTDKELGVYGKLAFDALKSMLYSRLVIDLDGSLEGEFVAGVQLDGVARDPTLTVTPAGGIKGMVASRALGQLAKIPFKFNIKVKGPFRALIGTMRSLHDPTLLIQSTLPDLIRGKPDAPPPVQPQESEIVR